MGKIPLLDIEIIDCFDGEFEFLSNFSDHSFSLDGVVWKTSEHAYQAAKTLDFDEAETVRLTKGPGAAKRAGRKVTVREDWDQVKGEIMRDILIAKFTQNPDILDALKNTCDAALIESNTWHDNIWGDCSCEKCEKKEGKNMLGNLLMWLREAY